MTTRCDLDLAQLPDLYWHECGQSSLSGDLLELFQTADKLFLDLASPFKAKEYFFPPFISAERLQKLDYFKSFPHLITMPVALEASQENLADFAQSPFKDKSSQLDLKNCEPVKEVLTPAACYHFYDELAGSSYTSDNPQYLTTRCLCFRREKEYKPLARQWAFNMREIICIGDISHVQAYLGEFEEILRKYFAARKLPVTFEYAQDPFFNPASNPKYLLQKLEPVKKEMIYDNHLSVGSLNFHRNFFGETFELTVAGEAAFSACVAFGLERWLYMILKEKGLSKGGWQL